MSGHPVEARPVRFRSAVRQNAIVDELRRRIVSGEWAPGSQLPPRRDLVVELDVSSVTLQRALDTLAEEGFVTSRQSQGTWVASAPPHLTRFALVFPAGPAADGRWNRFWVSLVNEANRLNHEAGADIRVYYTDEGKPGAEGYKQLLDDTARHLLAGLIFAHPPSVYHDSPLLVRPMPLVCLTESTSPGVVRVTVDLMAFIERGVAELAARGCRRIAVLASSIYAADGDFDAAFDRGLRRHRCASRPSWRLGVDLMAPAMAGNLMQLLFAHGSEHPDGLLIADDNLVEAATAGLVAARVRVGRALHVVAHCNFPWPTPSLVPATRLGFDARHLLRLALDAAKAGVDGRPVAPLTRMPPVTAEEIAGAQ